MRGSFSVEKINVNATVLLSGALCYKRDAIRPRTIHLAGFMFKAISNMKSENWGGLVSMAGSSLFALGGDASGALVTASFLAAEIVLTRWGHTRPGYSGGAALFALGDALATVSNVAHGNHTFQLALAGMAATWSIGVARAPLAWAGERLGNSSLVRLADATQPIAGVAILAQRIPAAAAAVIGGNYIGAAAVCCWGAADILVGRLQNTYRKVIGSLRQNPCRPRQAEFTATTTTRE